jgi:hypothetical protein
MAAIPFRSASARANRRSIDYGYRKRSRRLHAQRVAWWSSAQTPRASSIFSRAHEAAQSYLYEQLAGITVSPVEAKDDDTDVSKPAK